MIAAQTHDLIFLTFKTTHGYKLAERILIREKQTCEFLIDDDDPLGVFRICSKEVAPL